MKEKLMMGKKTFFLFFFLPDWVGIKFCCVDMTVRRWGKQTIFKSFTFKSLWWSL